MGLDLVKNILHYFVFFSHFITFCTEFEEYVIKNKTK